VKNEPILIERDKFFNEV
jgi:hypothetical protein